MTKPYKFTTKKQKSMPPVDLRYLPGDMVTKEHADDTRIHEHDPQHIRKALIRKKMKALVRQAPPEALAHLLMATWLKTFAKEDRNRDLDQLTVDVLLGRELTNRVSKRPIKFDVDHLWPLEDYGWAYTIKKGAAPANGDRPKYLRNLELNIDVLDWPERIRDTLTSGGVPFEKIMEGVLDAKRKQDFWTSVKTAAGETVSQRFGESGPQRIEGGLRESRIVGSDGQPVVS